MRDKLRDPVFWSDVTQLVKTVVAVSLAWVLAVELIGTPQSFLAPWAALLVVQATVFRTFSQGARQVAAAVAGVLLAWSAGNLIGPDVAALGAVVFLGLLLGRSRLLEGEATTAAATALVVLTTGFSDDQLVLVDRLLDTGIGIAVGLVVNVAVWPPLRRRSAIAALDALDNRIGGLLVEVGDGLAGECSRDDVAGWLETTRDLDEEIDRAWAMVRQARESAVLNPRRSARQLRHPEVWIVLLRHMEQAVAETRSIARTLERFLEQQREWDANFRDGYVDAMRHGGRAIEDADADAIRDCRSSLDEIVGRLGEVDPVPELWPVYGGLVVNLVNILEAMEEVAAANPLDQPPLPMLLGRRRTTGRPPG
ncbi:MAG TPA: aromatic acid exporter family protein [Intrasporangium sp.]|nr:aromatic acid exporter family protein [Intrasporangium sp.]